MVLCYKLFPCCLIISFMDTLTAVVSAFQVFSWLFFSFSVIMFDSKCWFTALHLQDHDINWALSSLKFFFLHGLYPVFGYLRVLCVLRFAFCVFVFCFLFFRLCQRTVPPPFCMILVYGLGRTGQKNWGIAFNGFYDFGRFFFIKKLPCSLCFFVCLFLFLFSFYIHRYHDTILVFGGKGETRGRTEDHEK